MIRDSYGNLIDIKLKRGDQILYVPTHLYEDWTEKGDVFKIKFFNQLIHRKKFWGYPSGIQPGFVTSGPNNSDGYFCRYWKFDERNQPTMTLRTKWNSESTPDYALVLYSYWNVKVVQQALALIDEKKVYT